MHKNLRLEDLPTREELRLTMVPDISPSDLQARFRALDEAQEALRKVRDEQRAVADRVA